MDLSDSRLLALLRAVERARQEHELTARLTGENFNVFNILGLSTAEVRTHSAFIAELLNPNGSHGQGSVYLELFLKKFDIGEDAFTADRARVNAEIDIGGVNLEEGTGGRIDILLTDGVGRHILVENKVYAGDQDSQLLRYHNFDKTAVLVYLTLDGREPDERSTGGDRLKTSLTKCEGKLRLVSYGADMTAWLDECHRASVSLPVVRETILQYRNLIRRLTHQTTGDKVIEDAKKLILANPELADGVALAWEALSDMIRMAKGRFVAQMTATIPNVDYCLDDGTVFERLWDEQVDGVCIWFRTKAKREGGSCQNAQMYAQVLRSAVPSAKSNPNWDIGWFNPEPFEPYVRFENLPKPLIVSLYKSDAELKAFVARIKERAEAVTDKLLAGIRGLQ